MGLSSNFTENMSKFKNIYAGVYFFFIDIIYKFKLLKGKNWFCFSKTNNYPFKFPSDIIKGIRYLVYIDFVRQQLTIHCATPTLINNTCSSKVPII